MGKSKHRPCGGIDEENVMNLYAGFNDTNDKQQWAYPDVEHAKELCVQ